MATFIQLCSIYFWNRKCFPTSSFRRFESAWNFIQDVNIEIMNQEVPDVSSSSTYFLFPSEKGTHEIYFSTICSWPIFQFRWNFQLWCSNCLWMHYIDIWGILASRSPFYILRGTWFESLWLGKMLSNRKCLFNSRRTLNEQRMC